MGISPSLRAPYKVEFDKMGKSIAVSLGQGRAKKFVLECSRPDQDQVLVKRQARGRLSNDSLDAATDLAYLTTPEKHPRVVDSTPPVRTEDD
jgi:hypothetical protein